VVKYTVVSPRRKGEGMMNRMKKIGSTGGRIIVILAILGGGFGSAVAQTTVPHTFSAGDTARAQDVNENFQALADAINAIGSPAGGGSASCAGNDATDMMVKSGSLCVDKYEASVWSSPLAGGTQYGAGSDNYPCGKNGNDCSGSKAIYARSQGGVTPSANITWFQAQQACAMSGKRLLSNAEWQMAAAGTADAGTNEGLSNSMCNTAGGTVRQTGNAGSTPGASGSCISNWGVEDMAGNLSEWVADWAHGDNGGTWSPSNTLNTITYQADLVAGMNPATSQGGGESFPAALIRGGNNLEGLGSGIFAIRVTRAPSYWASGIGFRCAK
jgi:hypothetical protein